MATKRKRRTTPSELRRLKALRKKFGLGEFKKSRAKRSSRSFQRILKAQGLGEFSGL